MNRCELNRAIRSNVMHRLALNVNVEKYSGQKTTAALARV